jgi:hypothetical protein
LDFLDSKFILFEPVNYCNVNSVKIKFLSDLNYLDLIFNSYFFFCFKLINPLFLFTGGLISNNKKFIQALLSNLLFYCKQHKDLTYVYCFHNGLYSLNASLNKFNLFNTRGPLLIEFFNLDFIVNFNLILSFYFKINRTALINNYLTLLGIPVIVFTKHN